MSHRLHAIYIVLILAGAQAAASAEPVQKWAQEGLRTVSRVLQRADVADQDWRKLKAIGVDRQIETDEAAFYHLASTNRAAFDTLREAWGREADNRHDLMLLWRLSGYGDAIVQDRYPNLGQDSRRVAIAFKMFIEKNASRPRHEVLLDRMASNIKQIDSEYCTVVVLNIQDWLSVLPPTIVTDGEFVPHPVSRTGRQAVQKLLLKWYQDIARDVVWNQARSQFEFNGMFIEWPNSGRDILRLFQPELGATRLP